MARTNREVLAFLEKVPAGKIRPLPTKRPEWACGTVYPETYTLDITPGGGGGLREEIFLERSEYIALKAVLGRLRGYGPCEDLLEELREDEETEQ